MAFLTIPGTVEREVAATITLDKTDLFALSPISGDAYFSDPANCSKVLIEWNSNPGNQKEIGFFDLSLASPSHPFLVSDVARSSFLVERLILVDFDSGELVLSRSQLDAAIVGGVSQFDITIT